MKRLFISLSVFFALSTCVFAQSPIESSVLQKTLSATIFFTDKKEFVNDKQWISHPKFKGVYLKHLILGKDTNGQFSCHIVKIEQGCVLDSHVHEGKYELHEIVAGSGRCILDGKEVDYNIGTISLIPPDTEHKVTAGKDGLYLLAKFVPALQ